MMNKSKTAILLIALLFSFCEIQGADLYWRVTAVNNNFNNAANWTDSPTGVGGTSPGTPPTILDNVYFTNTSNYMDIKPTGTGNMRNLTVTAAGYKFSQNNINIASVVVGNTLSFMTNASYHQGAGVSMVTFSSGGEGVIYNAGPQVVDYKTSLRSGIVIAPDEGYLFSGWSHDDYVSLRGQVVSAEKGIMQYDTLTVYGDLELHADFEPEIYSIRYYMNNSDNPEENPLSYTIESEAVMLEAPIKPGDTFVGWTGSNGDVPQIPVTISKGETGERVFYANFLYSGIESVDEEITAENKERIWAAKGILYVESFKSGNIIKIYTMDGVLQKQSTINVEGIKEFKLNRGIYIVTRNDGAGEKVRVE